MHEDCTVSKGAVVTAGAEDSVAGAEGSGGRAKDWGSVRVSAASAEIVAAVTVAGLSTHGRVASNVARLAMINAVRLAQGTLPHAHIRPPDTSPLAVPAAPAQLHWQITYAPVIEDRAVLSDPRPAADLAQPADHETRAPGIAAPAAVASPWVAPDAAAQDDAPFAGLTAASHEASEPGEGSVGRHGTDEESPGGLARGGFDVFTFRPGDRVLPRLPGGVRGSAETETNAGGRHGALTDPGQLLAPSLAPARPARPELAPRPPQAAVAVEPLAPSTGQPASKPRPRVLDHLRRAVRWTAYALLAWYAAMLALIVLFRFVDPPGSTLIAWQALTGTRIEQQWVPLTRISRNLQRAVIVSEDGRFCQHWGIDPREILAAIKRARNGVPRGASTITMQVAKNLFLWSSKSYVRKLLELPLTLALEVIWSKERILEVYLNIAEWGPGVFGAEAAARHHFGKSAARLSQNEAALLAVALPNPIRRDAGEPGRGTSRLASIIVARMRSAGPVTSCIARSR